jgi:hypothetical protein
MRTYNWASVRYWTVANGLTVLPPQVFSTLTRERAIFIAHELNRLDPPAKRRKWRAEAVLNDGRCVAEQEIQFPPMKKPSD